MVDRRRVACLRSGRALLTGMLIALTVAAACFCAPAASARPAPGGPPATSDHWRITGHGKKYSVGGAWHNCAAYTKRSYSYNLGCSFSESVGNTVSGSVSVSYGALSASVGYSVTRTQTVGANASFSIAPHTSGHIQYHQTYVGTPVYQKKYRCPGQSTSGPSCRVIAKATAYTHKWAGTEFRKV